MASDLDLTDERRDEMIEWVAQQIHKRGLTTPAVFFIEMNRPLSYIGGQAVHFFSPFVNALFDTKLATEVGHLMSDRKNIDRLIDRLEELTREQEIAERRARKKARVEAPQAAAGPAAGPAAPPPDAEGGPSPQEGPRKGFLGAVGKLFKRK